MPNRVAIQPTLAIEAQPTVEIPPEALELEFRARWFPVALFSILWLDLIRQLSYQWSNNPQYAYGWFVPLLALGLFWKRWSSRSQINRGVSLVNNPSSVILSVVVFAVALLLLPLRVIHDINQDWPLFSWPLALGVVVISLYAMFLAGGWPCLRHFAFPMCFILVAVNWPYRLESRLTHALMRLVVSLTVGILGRLDVMASQHGNLIELSTGVVGVDEACSGIRSFQATIMGSLFLGELYRLRWLQRFGLLVGGIFLAFCLNVVRTLILTWHASDTGLEVLKKWHDPAGFAIFLASFGLLWAGAGWLKSRRALQPLDPSLPRGLPAPSMKASHSVVCRYLLAIGCWAVAIIGLNEVWYRSHELKRVESARWWVNLPTNLPTFSRAEVPESAVKLLKYDLGTVGLWQDLDGLKWQLFCFRWQAGNPTARMSALGHRPEYCLTGSGHELRADLGTRFISVAGLDLPFRVYVFDDSPRTLYVFFCLWEDGAEKQAGFGCSKTLDRLRSVLAGRRGLGQQTLEIVLNGCANIHDAECALRERLPDLIQQKNKPSREDLLSRKS
jgi:exosortase